MQPDPAEFRRSDILAVWHERPRCPLTLHWQWVDAHHILGRGYDHGYRKDDPERAIFSSIFNFIPLQRDIHKGPYRDHALMRQLFLAIAHKYVMNAVGAGSYELNEWDEKFLAALSGFGFS